MIIFGVLLFLLIIAGLLLCRRYLKDRKYFCSWAKVVYTDEKSSIVSIGDEERVENQFFRIEKPLKIDSLVIVIDLDKMNSLSLNRNLFYILNQHRLKKMYMAVHSLDQALYSEEDRESKAVIGSSVSKFKSIAFDKISNKPILLYHVPADFLEGDTVSYDEMVFPVSLRVTKLA